MCNAQLMGYAQAYARDRQQAAAAARLIQLAQTTRDSREVTPRRRRFHQRPPVRRLRNAV
jgi:hypothetical protein